MTKLVKFSPGKIFCLRYYMRAGMHALVYCTQYAVREAARKAGVWDSAPFLRDITQAQVDIFNKAVRYKMHANI